MRFFTFDCHSGILQDGVNVTMEDGVFRLPLGRTAGNQLPPFIPLSSSDAPDVELGGVLLLRASFGLDYSSSATVLKKEAEDDRLQAAIVVYASPTQEVLEVSIDRHGVVKRFKSAEIWGRKGFCPVLDLYGNMVDRHLVEILLLSPGDCAIVRPYGVSPAFSKGHITLACRIENGQVVVNVGSFKDYKTYLCQEDGRILSFHMRSGNTSKEKEVTSL